MEWKKQKKKISKVKNKKSNLLNLNKENDVLIIKEINHIKEINQKYETLSSLELKKELESRKKIINVLNKENENAKNNLITLIKNINESITKSAELMYKTQPNEESIKELEKMIDMKQKELILSKKIQEMFKNKCEKIIDKSNQVISFDSIPSLEKKIESMQIKNNILINQLKEIKFKKIISLKENYSENQKKELNLQNYTNEFKIFSNKKYELTNKINNNLKLIENEQKSYKKLEKLYETIKINDESDSDYKYTNLWMNILKNDLNGDIQNIISNIDNNNIQIIKEISKTKENKNIILPPVIQNYPNMNNSNSLTRINLNKSSNDITLKRNSSALNITQNYSNILNKYSLINQNQKNIKHLLLVNSLFHLCKNKDIKKLKKSESANNIFQEKNILDFHNEEELNIIYNTISENNYKDLLGKKDEYLELNSRINNSLKDYKKISEKKYKNISLTIKINQKHLKHLNEQNNILKKEIFSLEQVLSLKKQQKLMEKIISENEKKYFYPKLTKTNNEIYLNGNEKLNECNNIKDEDKKNTLENESNKNILSEFSNEEKSKDEILTEREKKIDKIKNKYSIDIN